MNTIKADNLAKRFAARKVFSDVSFEMTTGESLAVTGPNGAGKSTLLMALLGLLRPSRGVVSYLRDGDPLSDAERRRRVAFVAPYMALYDQLTAEENIKFLIEVSGGAATGKEINAALARVGLEGRGGDRFGEFSSGMKQRLKYALALLKKPDFLFLDEPTSNLDASGREMVMRVIEESGPHCALILATNEAEEARLATRRLELG